MSVTLDDGGPAFPQTVSAVGNGVRTYWGMSVRDYFAAAVIEGIYASMPYKEYITDRFITPEDMSRCAEVALAQADAMLNVGKQKPCACSETQSS